MSLFIPITKVDVAQRLVYGTLSEEIPDKSGEILDYASSKPAFEHWSDEFRKASGGKSLGNVRAMHGNVAAGKFTDIAFDDDNKRIEGVAKIIDDDEWEKVLEGVYTGFSIGGGYARRWVDEQHPELMRYTPVLSEVSLVDNPAVPTATFEVVKQDGSVELRKFSVGEKRALRKDDAPEIAQVLTDTAHLDMLRKELGWLKAYTQNENDMHIAQAIDTLLAYLDVNHAGHNSITQEDDTSAHAYDGEIQRLFKNGPIIQQQSLEPAIEHMREQMESLHKRIASLEAQPVPAKGIVRIFDKTDDYGVPQEDKLDKMTPKDRAHALMKRALANPSFI